MGRIDRPRMPQPFPPPGACLRRPATARLGDYSRRLAGHPVDDLLADGHLRYPAADHPVDGLPHSPAADHPADGHLHYPVADHPAGGLPHYPVAAHPADGHLHCPVDGHPRCPAADYLAGDRQHSRVADGPHIPRRRSAWRTASRRPSRTGSWRRRRRMIRPTRALVVPRPPAIIIAPISPDREGHDRQADHGAVAHHRHIAAPIGIAEPPCIDPATQIRRGDVTPLVTADTTHHGHGHPARQLRHDGVVSGRPGAHIDAAVRVGLRLR